MGTDASSRHLLQAMTRKSIGMAFGGVVLLLFPLAALAQDAAGTMLDISRPLLDLPAVTPQSSPDDITGAIQARLNYLLGKNVAGRVFLPAGTWTINKPLFMTGSAMELVGAGADVTTLRAADGYRAMPMVNMAVRDYQAERPYQSVNRVPLTAPGGRVLDASVEGERYGIRTYTEYPATHFPAVSHLAVPASAQVPAWQAGHLYKVDDIVLLHPGGTPRGIDAVCVQAHTAAAENQPYSGPAWKDFWVLRLPFNMQFFGDPLAAGPYDPVSKRASDWEHVGEFTFDFAFTLNGDPKFLGTRPLCGAVTNYVFDPKHRSWLLDLQDGQRLQFDFTLADGSAKSFVVSPSCTAAGTYRVALQISFAAHTVQAWLRKPGEAEFTRTVNDTSLPAASGFQQLEYGFFSVLGGEGGTTADGNANADPPLDLTVCGLHMSNVLRYADSPTLLQRHNNTASDDQSRYFAQEPGTMAFLPLTDNPAPPDVAVQERLITVQHGDASGDAGQKGYGYLQVPTGTYGLGAHRVSDMTISPGPTWGAGIVTWNTIDARMSGLNIKGGYYAIGDLFLGAQYTFDVRDCVLSGSEAAYNGMMNIIYMRHCTIDPVGRYGILVSGSNCVLDDVTFGETAGHRSEYYFRGLGTALYGGMNTFRRINATAAHAGYPSKAAFSMTDIWVFRTSMIMQNVHVANLGPAAVFLDLPLSTMDGHGVVTMSNCSYTGSPIAAFIRTNSFFWSGPVMGVDAGTPVKKWVDLVPPALPPWALEKSYEPGNKVLYNGLAYSCTAKHLASSTNQPGAAAGQRLWQPIMSNFVFSWSRS